MAKNEKEWRALGSELVEAYNHLMNALRRISDLPPMRKSDTTALSKAIDWTGRAKAHLEDEMFRRGGPGSIHIFYPGPPESGRIERRDR
jgi:hypothetical protein